MAEPMDRRRFLSGSAKAVAAAAVVGGGSSLLAACGGGSSKSSSGSTSKNRNVGVSTGTPKQGGALRFGTTSEIDGYDPAQNHWDAAGATQARTVYDPLGILMPDGTVQPYLASAIQHNQDYTQWTITARDGVTFHDGEKFDGAAIATNLNTMRSSRLAGPALTPVKNVTAKGMDCIVEMNQPWVPFDINLTGFIGGQIAYMVSPKAIKGGKVSTHPVGTGPFTFVEWQPGDHFSVKKNTGYWRKGLPYLDSITFHPIPDSQQRENSLKSGSLDLMYAGSARNIVDFQNDDNYAFLSSGGTSIGEPDMSFFQINCLKPPLSDVTLRQALAYALDQQQLVKVSILGVGSQFLPVTGPFLKGSPYYADSGYPTKPDLAKAKSLVQAWSAKNGGKKPAFKLGTVNDPADVQICTQAQSMFTAAGFDVQIVQVEQAQYITNALVGNYDVYIWTQFGAADPDANYIWWSTKTIGGIGSLSLNFARNKDDQIQAALESGRTSTDKAAREQAYQTVMKQMGTDVPYLWFDRTIGAVIASPKVQNFANPTAPDSGKQGLGYLNGIIYPTQIWLGS